MSEPINNPIGPNITPPIEPAVDSYKPLEERKPNKIDLMRPLMEKGFVFPDDVSTAYSKKVISQLKVKEKDQKKQTKSPLGRMTSAFKGVISRATSSAEASSSAASSSAPHPKATLSQETGNDPHHHSNIDSTINTTLKKLEIRKEALSTAIEINYGKINSLFEPESLAMATEIQATFLEEATKISDLIEELKKYQIDAKKIFKDVEKAREKLIKKDAHLDSTFAKTQQNFNEALELKAEILAILTRADKLLPKMIEEYPGEDFVSKRGEEVFLELMNPKKPIILKKIARTPTPSDPSTTREVSNQFYIDVKRNESFTINAKTYQSITKAEIVSIVDELEKMIGKDSLLAFSNVLQQGLLADAWGQILDLNPNKGLPPPTGGGQHWIISETRDNNIHISVAISFKLLDEKFDPAGAIAFKREMTIDRASLKSKTLPNIRVVDHHSPYITLDQLPIDFQGMEDEKDIDRLMRYSLTRFS